MKIMYINKMPHYYMYFACLITHLELVSWNRKSQLLLFIMWTAA